MMVGIMKEFVFSREFDLEIQKEKQEAELRKASPLVYTAEDLRNAVEETKKDAFDLGFEQGIAEGRTQALQEIEQSTLVAIEELKPVLMNILNEYESHRQYITRTGVEFVLAFLKKLSPNLVSEGVDVHLSTFIESSISAALGSPTLELRFGKDVYELGRQKTANYVDIHSFEGKIEYILDENINPKSATSYWKNGRAEFDLEIMVEQMFSTLNSIKTQQQI